MTDHTPPDPLPDNWPTFSPHSNNAHKPLPANKQGNPCGTCKRLDHYCPHIDPEFTHALRGRPTNLTPDIIAAADHLVSEGNRVNLIWAHQDIDVPESTWYHWINRGREDHEDGRDTIFSDFLETIARAEARAIMNLDEEFRQGDAKRSHALGKYLALRWPDLYSEKRVVEHQGSGGGPVEFRIVMDELDQQEQEAEA